MRGVHTGDSCSAGTYKSYWRQAITSILSFSVASHRSFFRRSHTSSPASSRRVSRVLGLKCVKPRALKRVAFWTSSHRSFSDPEVVSRPARKATHGGARYRNREEFLIRWTGFRDLQYVRVRCAWTSIDGQKVRTRTPLSSGVG
jgi:hypothetical protein